MTRKLTIRSKLAAALAVPLVALSAVVAIQVRTSHSAANAAQLEADLATSAIGPSGMVAALQHERNLQVLRGLGLEDAEGAPAGDVETARKETNRALQTFQVQLNKLDSTASDAYLSALNDVHTELGSLRDDADAATAGASLEQASAAQLVFDRYTKLVNGLLDANERVPVNIDDAQLRTGAELLDAMSRQDEIETRIVYEAILASVLQDDAAAIDVQRLIALRDAGESRVRNLASGEYAGPVLDVLSHTDRIAYVQALESNSDPTVTDPDALMAAVPNGLAQLSSAEGDVALLVATRAEDLRGDAALLQRVYLLAALGAIGLALLMMRLANRWITRPLTRLADEARVMAAERLPEAVQSILETPPGEDVTLPQIEPVHVQGGGEVAGVVDALNAVQESALRLAVEQAVLRRNIGDSFVNLGRRNQNLLARQLELITHLESEESDSESLEQLFKLDHLATRMRRNAESLLVLAGEEPARQWSEPVAIGDVVRAALGEVEQFSRVRFVDFEPTTVVGSAVADVSHILAELVENGLSFSPPDTPVEIHAHAREDGYMISIVDAGIGMSEADMERADQRLRAAESFTIAPSRYLGHYVVANLAARHGIDVRVHPAPSGGLAATVLLPVALLADRVADTPPRDVEAPEVETRDVEMPVVAAVPVVPEPVVEMPVYETPVYETPVAEVVAEEFELPAPVLAAPEPAPAPEPEPQPEPQPEPVPEPVAEPVVAVVPAPPPEPEFAPRGIFATMLHTPAPIRGREPEAEPVAEDESASVAPAAAVVEATPAPEPSAAAAAAALYSVPIEDDLLPRLPKRAGRRGKGSDPAAPARPVVAVPSIPNVVTAEDIDVPSPAAQAAAIAPTLPRRVNGVEEAPASVPVASEGEGASSEAQPLRSYELFAAFRAATDLGRADARDGGTQ